MKTHSLFLAVFTGAVLWLGIGCQSPGPATHGSEIEARAANYGTTLLHEGDTLSITFQYSSNFNTLQRITLDGSLNLDSVGIVKAAGKTTQELQDEVAGLYKALTKGDVVTVKLVTPASSVSVAGAVFRPGRIALDRPMTVLEAVIEAGGYDPNRANLKKVTVLRIVDGKQQLYRVDLNRVIQGKEETPFYLRAFDIVHVPAKMFNY